MKPFDWTRLFIWPYKVYTQLVFWIIVFALYIILKEYPERLTGASLICLVLQEVLELAIPSYSQNLLILPFFRRGKWLLAIVLYLLQVVLLVWLIPYALNGVGLLFNIRDRVDWRNEHIGFSVIAFTVVATFFKVGLDRLILDKEQKENELRHLKAQLNPHFLFNTLNNLYGLSVSGSRELPDLMLKLSDLLRYSLYDTNQHYVSLQKELNYITNYVELERIRLNDRADIVLDIRGDFSDRYIAPLLLIVFIENSFKHFSFPRKQQGFVNISLNLQGDFLQMNARNSVDPDYVPSSKNKDKGGGLGLNNVRQRLALIYPEKHTLVIKHEPGYFEVDLQIDLS
ncbi:Histidine kinase [Chitinophaga sp. CF118]|uniref:sensor histidine kinase n=1 Tax=Chitinophaga sp. CF118 TaxID=1884367 RepID=UPI0008EFAEFC|nr:sensor histidine kinase [Chitinophaga sp. CF118]SFD07634.1 Histidine kinase [Chitinophaga sp. CF118]